MKEFKKGDIILSFENVGSNYMNNQKGIVIGESNHVKIDHEGKTYCVQFFNNIFGHDGTGMDGSLNHKTSTRGKQGYCWYIRQANMKLLDKNKRIP